MIGQQPRRSASGLTKLQTTPPPRQRFAVRVIVLYTIVIFFVAAWSSFAGYQWARQNVLQAAMLPGVIQPGEAPAGDQNNGTVSDNTLASNATGSEAATVALKPITILLMGTDERPQEQELANTDTLIL